jgi:hypothetical protein
MQDQNLTADEHGSARIYRAKGRNLLHRTGLIKTQSVRFAKNTIICRQACLIPIYAIRHQQKPNFLPPAKLLVINLQLLRAEQIDLPLHLFPYSLRYLMFWHVLSMSRTCKQDHRVLIIHIYQRPAVCLNEAQFLFRDDPALHNCNLYLFPCARPPTIDVCITLIISENTAFE